MKILAVVGVLLWTTFGVLNYRADDCHRRTEWPWATNYNGNVGPGAADLDGILAIGLGPLATLGVTAVLGDKCGWLP